MRNDSIILRSWGANLAVVSPDQRAEPEEALFAVESVMRNPTARRVGAALCVLHKISLEYPDLFLSLAKPKEEAALRRLGYLLECGNATPLWILAANRIYDLRDNSYEGLVGLLSQLRPSDYHRHVAEINLRWRVLAPTDVWHEYTKPGDRNELR